MAVPPGISVHFIATALDPHFRLGGGPKQRDCNIEGASPDHRSMVVGFGRHPGAVMASGPRIEGSGIADCGLRGQSCRELARL
jgi:hypothetical protein